MVCLCRARLAHRCLRRSWWPALSPLTPCSQGPWRAWAPGAPSLKAEVQAVVSGPDPRVQGALIRGENCMYIMSQVKILFFFPDDPQSLVGGRWMEGAKQADGGLLPAILRNCCLQDLLLCLKFTRNKIHREMTNGELKLENEVL